MMYDQCRMAAGRRHCAPGPTRSGYSPIPPRPTASALVATATHYHLGQPHENGHISLSNLLERKRESARHILLEMDIAADTRRFGCRHALYPGPAHVRHDQRGARGRGHVVQNFSRRHALSFGRHVSAPCRVPGHRALLFLCARRCAGAVTHGYAGRRLQFNSKIYTGPSPAARA